jgi:hypothetical protein
MRPLQIEDVAPWFDEKFQVEISRDCDGFTAVHRC